MRAILCEGTRIKGTVGKRSYFALATIQGMESATIKLYAVKWYCRHHAENYRKHIMGHRVVLIACNPTDPKRIN